MTEPTVGRSLWPPRYRHTPEGMTLDPKGAYVLLHTVEVGSEPLTDNGAEIPSFRQYVLLRAVAEAAADLDEATDDVLSTQFGSALNALRAALAAATEAGSE